MVEKTLHRELNHSHIPLFDIREELKTSNLPPALKEQIIRLLTATEQAPVGKVIAYTGRGVFTEQQFPDGAKVTLYTKGTGTVPEARQQEPDGAAQQYPMEADISHKNKARRRVLMHLMHELTANFNPAELSRHRETIESLNDPIFQDPLYYDDVYGSTDPRIRGTITTPSAMIEVLTALAVLEGLSETHQNRWHSAVDILAAGVSIPISVVEDPILSSDMSKLRAERLVIAAEEVGKQEKSVVPSGLASDANDHLGLIRLLVPDHIRLNRLSEQGKFYDDPAVAVNTAVTLRELREIGAIYSFLSSHIQNLYAGGGSADSGELVFLADYPHQAQQRQVLFTHFNRRSGMFPYPSLYPEHRNRSEGGLDAETEYLKMKEYFHSFWREYLRDDLGSIGQSEIAKRVANLFRLMAFFRSESNLALAEICLDRFDDPEYTRRSMRLSARRAALLDAHDSESLPLNKIISDERKVNLLTTKKKLVEFGLSDMEADSTDPKVSSWKRIYDYLKSGDEKHLRDSEQISQVLTFWEQFDAKARPSQGMLEFLHKTVADGAGNKQFNMNSIGYSPRDPTDLKRLLAQAQYLLR